MFLQHVLLSVYTHSHAPLLSLLFFHRPQMLPHFISLFPQLIDLSHQQGQNLLELCPAATVTVESRHYFLDILVLISNQLDHLHLFFYSEAISGGGPRVLSKFYSSWNAGIFMGFDGNKVWDVEFGPHIGKVEIAIRLQHYCNIR